MQKVKNLTVSEIYKRLSVMAERKSVLQNMLGRGEITRADLKAIQEQSNITVAILQKELEDQNIAVAKNKKSIYKAFPLIKNLVKLYLRCDQILRIKFIELACPQQFVFNELAPINNFLPIVRSYFATKVTNIIENSTISLLDGKNQEANRVIFLKKLSDLALNLVS